MNLSEMMLVVRRHLRVPPPQIVPELLPPGNHGTGMTDEQVLWRCPWGADAAGC